MQKWEYKLVEGWQTIDQLTALGSEGWELVSTEVGVGNHNMAFYFKRPAADENDHSSNG